VKHIALEWDRNRGGAPFLTHAQDRILRESLFSCQPDTTVIGFYRGSRSLEFEDRDRLARRVLGDADRDLLATCCPAYAISIGIRLTPPNRDCRDSARSLAPLAALSGAVAQTIAVFTIFDENTQASLKPETGASGAGS
jgi:hypothetical protein